MKFNAAKAKQLVEASRLKREAIAKDCTISKDSLSAILNGHRSPGAAVARLLSQALEVSETDLWIEDQNNTHLKKAAGQ